MTVFSFTSRSLIQQHFTVEIFGVDNFICSCTSKRTRQKLLRCKHTAAHYNNHQNGNVNFSLMISHLLTSTVHRIITTKKYSLWLTLTARLVLFHCCLYHHQTEHRPSMYSLYCSSLLQSEHVKLNLKYLSTTWYRPLLCFAEMQFPFSMIDYYMRLHE